VLQRFNDSLFDEESPQLDRFGLLLVVTIAAIVVQSLVHMRRGGDDIESNLGTLTVAAFVGATFLIALSASGLRRRWRRIAMVMVLGSIGVLLLVILVEATTDVDTSAFQRAGPPIGRTFLAVATPIAVVRRLASHRVVRGSTLIGAISVYLLIALAAHYVFLFVDLVESTPFFGQPEPTTRFMYFSLVTLTTLGYGDLVPVTDWGGLMANIEAVTGQVFLVTFVAGLVGLLIGQRRKDEHPG
jgi:voltage-gated potassium channel Kch